MINPLIRLAQSLVPTMFPMSTNNSGNYGDNMKMDFNTPIPFGGPAIYENPNSLRFVRDGFISNASVYTITSRIARKFGMLPRYVYQVADKQMERKASMMMKNMGMKVDRETLNKFKRYWKYAYHEPKTKAEFKAYSESISNSPLSELLMRPNQWQGQDAFFELLAVYYLIVGEGFIWLNRGDTSDYEDAQIDKMPVLEMFVLPSQYIELLPDPNDVWGVQGYYFRIGGIRRYIRKNDMIHWRMPNPDFDAYTRKHLRGLSPLQPGNKLLTQDESATDASVALEQNLGSRGVMFDKNLKLNPAQASAVKNVMDQKINNADLRGAIAQIQGDWGFIDLAMTAVEMDLENAKDSVFKRICNLYHISPDIFMAGTTFENTQQAMKDLITGVCFPMAASLKDEMNRMLLPAFGLNPSAITHDIDITDLAEMQEDQKLLTDRNAASYWKSINEKRQSENLEPLSDPNADKLFIPSNLIPLDEAALNDPEPKGSFEPDDKNPQPDFGKFGQDDNNNGNTGKSKSNGSPILS